MRFVPLMVSSFKVKCAIIPGMDLKGLQNWPRMMCPEKSHWILLSKEICWISLSQQLFADRLEQAHVLCAPDGQPVEGVVCHHLRHGPEGLAELAQDDVSRGVALDAHVHEAAGGSGNRKL